MRTALTALAAVFLAAHLALLPPALGDIDSINFAMGVRDFDVAQHQPHPPGYPVFIALGKVSTAALRGAGVSAPEARGLALWSAIAGAVLIPLGFWLFMAVDGDPLRAWWATGIAAAAPLFWMTAQRPLSDAAGLAFAVAAQALLASAVRWSPGQRSRPAVVLLAGAFLAGFAIGVRSQAFLLTLPILALALAAPAAGVSPKDRVAAVAAAGAGVLAWAIPLVAVSGGVDSYLAALQRQGAEDFSGVVMLWTRPSPRVAALALMNSFVWPWASALLGAAVCALAVVGFFRMAARAPSRLAIVAAAFGPYAAFHLLFQDTAFVRYALPLLLPASLFAVQALSLLGRRAVAIGGAAIAAASLVIILPASRTYAAEPNPAFEVVSTAARSNVRSDAPAARPVVAMHALFRRVAEWVRADETAELLRAPHGHEWLRLVDYWRNDPSARVWFAADPRRTDLALIDPWARALETARRWDAARTPVFGGTRPVSVDLYRLNPPGWILDRGWALTAEIAGVSAREGAWPHLRPSTAWVRARDASSLLMIGGRNMGDGDAMVSVVRDGQPLAAWQVPGGFFFRVLPVGRAALSGSGYLPMSVTAAAAPGATGATSVSLEQFDLQPDGVPMVGFEDGWHEPEYNPATAVAWRWMSERGTLWVRPIGRDVTLTISGESPLRYFDVVPLVRVSARGMEIARFGPRADFSQEIVLPRAALDSAQGRITVETDYWFSPAARGGSADQRHLGLRIYSVRVK